MKSIEKDCYGLIQGVAIKRNPICRYPGCPRPSVVGHHLFKRDRLATAFLPEAVWGLCDHHHKIVHAYPMAWKEIVMGLIGQTEYYRLLMLSNCVEKNFNFKETKKNLQLLLKGDNHD